MLTDAERDAIIAANQMDLELYQLATEMFWEMWK